jgi:LmbE family N-acetylglucosaminyl deacetylase
MSYPEQLVRGVTAHSVKQLYFYGTDRPNYWVDISSSLPTKLDALHPHASQMSASVDERIRIRAIQAGAALTYSYAEAFHRYTLS